MDHTGHLQISHREQSYRVVFLHSHNSHSLLPIVHPEDLRTVNYLLNSSDKQRKPLLKIDRLEAICNHSDSLEL